MPSTENYITQAAADARYQTLGGLSSSTPSTIDNGDVGSAGASSSASRADHEHGFTIPNYTQIINPPSARVYHSTTQNLTHNTITALTFNSERWDTHSLHDTVTNNTRLTAPVAGLYLIEGGFSMQAATDYTEILCFIRLNGSTILRTHPDKNPGTANTEKDLTVTTVYKLAANDYVELCARHQNGASALRTTSVNANWSPEFSMTWIGVG